LRATEKIAKKGIIFKRIEGIDHLFSLDDVNVDYGRNVSLGNLGNGCAMARESQ